MNARDVFEGRNLQTEVLVRMNVDQINSAARCYRPDLRASTADVVAWAHLWNRSGHFCAAHVLADGDRAYVRLMDEG